MTRQPCEPRVVLTDPWEPGATALLCDAIELTRTHLPDPVRAMLYRWADGFLTATVESLVPTHEGKQWRFLIETKPCRTQGDAALLLVCVLADIDTETVS